MITVNIKEMIGFDKYEKEKLQDSVIYLSKYINGESFKNEVLNFHWLGKNQFADNNGLSNLEIYNLIMSGKEVLTPTEDHVLDISITIYSPLFRGRNVIGYTYPNTPMQWINRRFFKSMNKFEIAGNLMHEWLHKVGFDHDYYWTPKRDYSVPYAIGNMVANAYNANKKTILTVGLEQKHG